MLQNCWLNFGPLPNQTFRKMFITSPCATLTTPSQLEKVYKDGVYHQTPIVFFCLASETLLCVIAGCQSCLDRFTWRHNSVLNFLVETLSSLQEYRIFAYLPGFNNPSITTEESYRPDLLLESRNNSILYIIELTIGFESNFESNAHRKKIKYKRLINGQKQYYNDVKFINLSISALGVFGKECKSYLEMLDSLGFDDKHKKYFIRKMALSIRSTYYVYSVAETKNGRTHSC